MNIKPQGKKLIVKPIEQKEEVTDSGIVIPGVANANLQKGEIVAVGVELHGFAASHDGQCLLCVVPRLQYLLQWIYDRHAPGPALRTMALRARAHIPVSLRSAGN